MAVKGSVPTAGVIVPHLIVRDSVEAVNFYSQAFSARVLISFQKIRVVTVNTCT